MTSTAPSRVIPALLEAIAGEPPAGALLVLVHALRNRVRLDPAAIRPDWIPTAILEALEVEDSAHVHLATVDDGHAAPRQLAVAAVTFTVGRIYERGEHQMDLEALDAARAKLQACSVAPTFVLLGATPLAGAGWRVAGIWALAEPFDLRTDEGRAAATALHADLAAGLEADAPPADLAALAVEVPGSRMRESPARAEYAACLAVGDLARRYTPAALRAALLQEETNA